MKSCTKLCAPFFFSDSNRARNSSGVDIETSSSSSLLNTPRSKRSFESASKFAVAASSDSSVST